jgi:hypothetical protein
LNFEGRRRCTVDVSIDGQILLLSVTAVILIVPPASAK